MPDLVIIVAAKGLVVALVTEERVIAIAAAEKVGAFGPVNLIIAAKSPQVVIGDPVGDFVIAIVTSDILTDAKDGVGAEVEFLDALVAVGAGVFLVECVGRIAKIAVEVLGQGVLLGSVIGKAYIARADPVFDNRLRTHAGDNRRVANFTHSRVGIRVGERIAVVAALIIAVIVKAPVCQEIERDDVDFHLWIADDLAVQNQHLGDVAISIHKGCVLDGLTLGRILIKREHHARNLREAAFDIRQRLDRRARARRSVPARSGSEAPDRC